MNTKPRYDLLDGLRGVAALSVLCFHLFEAIAFAEGKAEQDMFHGFLAVDFFFILSGFVMGYAYDERWKQMSTRQFLTRRLIRLHPMMIAGATLGLIAFCVQGCARWDGTVMDSGTVLIGFILSLLMLPTLCSSINLRGNTELFPLNGPHWSVFLEYIGSIAYALMLRKMSTRTLRIWVMLAAIALIANGFIQGNLCQGWGSAPENILGGVLRLSFGYPMGLLMAREASEGRLSKLSSKALSGVIMTVISLVLLLCVPSLSWLNIGIPANAIYESLSVIVLFPCLVAFAARIGVEGKTRRICAYLGRLSYPLYAIHYPFIYLYIHWLMTGQHPFGTWTGATPIGISLTCIILAVLLMHFYDEPLRKKLTDWTTRK